MSESIVKSVNEAAGRVKNAADDAVGTIREATDVLHKHVKMYRKYIPIAFGVVAVAVVAYSVLTDSHFHLHSSHGVVHTDGGSK